MKTCIIVLLLCTAVENAFCQNVVVWDFTTRNGESTELTRNLTREFEEALVTNGNYDVVERRSLGDLLAVIENEKSVQEIVNASSDALDGLRQRQIEQVVFGEVFEDRGSGEMGISIKIQELDGHITVIHSVYLRTGLIHDGQSRREKMGELVRGIRSPTVGSGSANIERENFLFELKACYLEDRDVTCEFAITNQGEDRELFVALDADHEVRTIDNNRFPSDWEKPALRFIQSELCS